MKEHGIQVQICTRVVKAPDLVQWLIPQLDPHTLHASASSEAHVVLLFDEESISVDADIL